MKIPLSKFDGGLWLSPPADSMPPGTLRRARGVHPLSKDSVYSRDGSTKLYTLTAHSIFYFMDHWITGVSTNVYFDDEDIKSGLGGGRLAFSRMPPGFGRRDWLFIAGGDELFKIGPFDVSLVIDGVYKWTASGNEWYMEVEAGGDPSIRIPTFIVEDGTVMNAGTAGSLAVGEWDWSSDTIYVRLTDGADPNGKADDFLVAGYVDGWGIDPPHEGPKLTDSGSGGNLTAGDYGYRITYFNSRTGHRSNAATPLTTSTKLLLHMNGDDQHIIFTDSSQSVHAVTAVANAQGDTAQKKFGTASLLCDGTGDYLSIPAHADFAFGDEPFTIDFHVRFNSFGAAAYVALFSQYDSATQYFTCGKHEYGIFFYMLDKIFLFGDITISASTWYHIAIIRGWGGNLNTWAICVDGVVKGTVTSDESFPSLAAVFKIGSSGNAWSVDLNGWVDEFRITKGNARWITTGFTVPTVEGNPVSDVTLAGANYTNLTNIPQSDDAQVDFCELWRTAVDGSAFFRCALIPDGATSFTDNVADADLESTELPIDNLKPYAWFDDCEGPHNASMFWITRTQLGERGRLYYSPIGRPEAVQGYIEVSSDDDPLQKIVRWGGMLAVLSEGKAYQIMGVNPYITRELSGIPGTTAPHTCIPTVRGLIYEAADGVRVLESVTSAPLISYDAVAPIFRGQSAGQLTTFTGVVATYARGEYIISDTAQTLALNLTKGTWRDCGVGANALYYATEVDKIGAAISTKLLDYEKEGDVQDDTSDFAFAIEPGHVRIAEGREAMVQFIHVDCNANSETLTVTLLHDGSTTALGNITGASRAVTTYPVMVPYRLIGIRITGTIGAKVEVFEVAAEIYDPAEESK